MSLNDAARLNNEGVHFLLDGSSPREAVAAFSRSLTIVKTLLMTKNRGSNDGEASSPDEELPSAPRMNTHIFFDDEQPVLACDHQEALHSTVTTPPFIGDEVEHFVFQNAILLNASFHLGVNDTVANNVHPGCTLFNLALLHHRMGVTEKNSAVLRKAEQLYRYCSTLLRGSAGADASSLLVLMAATNNLSQLLFQRSAFAEAKEGFQSMSYLMNQRPGLVQNVFSHSEFNAMLSNLLMAEALNLAPAA